MSSINYPNRHCEISDGVCPSARDWTSYPIEKDNSSGRNMDNWKSCNCVKDSDAQCCMKTKWRPKIYAGNPRMKCIKTKIFVGCAAQKCGYCLY